MSQTTRLQIAKIAFNHWREHPQLPRSKTDPIFEEMDPKLQETWLKMADSIIAYVDDEYRALAPKGARLK
jgi:hypothetical protein